MGEEQGAAARTAASVVAVLDAASIKRLGDRKPRQYIGASSIGHECHAYQALTLRGFPNNEIPGRVLRIFQQGHLLESEVVSDMKAAGFDVLEVDPSTGEQWEYKGLGGHVVCHLDGIVLIVEDSYLLEVKTMNKSRFSAFVRKGVAISDEKYYAQCQLGMHLSGLRRAFFIAINKDNSEYHAEIVHYDQKLATELMARAEQSMRMKVYRITKNRNAFICKMCSKSDACWNRKRDEDPDSCAKCQFAVPETMGSSKEWICTKHRKPATAVCEDFIWFRPS